MNPFYTATHSVKGESMLAPVNMSCSELLKSFINQALTTAFLNKEKYTDALIATPSLATVSHNVMNSTQDGAVYLVEGEYPFPSFITTYIALDCAFGGKQVSYVYTQNAFQNFTNSMLAAKLETHPQKLTEYCSYDPGLNKTLDLYHDLEHADFEVIDVSDYPHEFSLEAITSAIHNIEQQYRLEQGSWLFIDYLGTWDLKATDANANRKATQELEIVAERIYDLQAIADLCCTLATDHKINAVISAFAPNVQGEEYVTFNDGEQVQISHLV